MATRNIYAEHQPAGGSGSFLKFEDNKTVKVKIVSEPVIFDSIFKGNRSTKYAFLVYNLEDDEVQIMQLPKGGYLALASVAADPDYGHPLENDYFLKITRTGKEFQTKYNIIPMLKPTNLSEDIQEQIGEIDLVERLSASPNNERVAWLADEVDGKRPKEEKKDVEIEDEDEPVNLDDLPL